jgi:uncharacterized Zn finger protein
MSPWERGRGRFPSYSPKKPPPEHGIKLKKLGVTWWGQRWIEALEHVLGGDAGRLARGRTYARAGRTHDFEVKKGKIKARVTGSRPQPYRVEIALSQLSDGAWSDGIGRMSAKAQFAAELLGGEMPKQIDEVFRAAGCSLFPLQRADLSTSCSCPDWGDPCKHVAAVHYVLGEALDRDPFLLFELRGRSKDQVLGALRQARGADPAQEAAETTPSVTLHQLTLEDYERSPRALPALSFSFDAPSQDGAVLRQLGAPAGWHGDASPVEALSPLLRAAAHAARRLALAEPLPAEAPRSAPAAVQPPKKRAKPKPARAKRRQLRGR